MGNVKASGAERILSAPQSLLKRGFSAALSVVLAASLCGIAPAAAFADEADLDSQLALSTQSDLNTQAFNYSSSTNDARYELASSYSLLNPSDTSGADILDADGKLLPEAEDTLVTPVKLQNPWGSCWSFASTAACETSILSRAQKDGKGSEYSAKTLDLSELQLVLSSLRNGGAPEQYVGEAQAGEGYYNGTSDKNYGINHGGALLYASSIFASGIGPLYEKTAKYQNKEGLIQCTVTYKNGQVKTEYLTSDEAAKREAQSDVESVLKYCWAGNYKDADGETQYTTWSISDDLWNTSSFEFENSNILPDTQVWDKDGNFEGINQTSINNIKDELQYQNRAVSCAFFADVSTPDQTTGVAKYLNTNTWAHFTYNNPGVNHGVTIVGWDDDYPASNFDNDAHQKPEGNGAWLVKNSWGTETSDFPNGPGKGWGLENAQGQNTGYFWISYYDRTITALETYDFDLASYSDSDSYIIDQYDYLPQADADVLSSNEAVSSANIFTADEDMSIRTLSCLVAKPNTKVTYQLYLLDDDEDVVDPTDSSHSKKVLECDELYRYGGYHRLSLGGTDESTWIGVHEGQRYAVVTTQYCNDDKKYYVCAGLNVGKGYVEKRAEGEQYQAALLSAAQQSIYKEYYADLYNQYITEEGATKESAAKKADADANAKLETGEGKKKIEALYEQNLSDSKKAYFITKVNKGESVTNCPASSSEGVDGVSLDGGTEGSDGSWYDWKTVTDSADKQGYAIDNFSIKAYAELNEWASADEIDELAAAIAAAEAKLNAAKVSADGSDVSPSDTWMTQTQYDALAQAIADAKKLLESAGDYKSATEVAVLTPEQVGDAIASLAFDEQYGTKASIAPEGEDGDQPSDGDKTHSAKTSDTSLPATVALGCVAAIAAASAAAARRRKAQ